MSNLYLFLIPLVISIGHILGLRFEIRRKSYSNYLQSFAAGVSIAYVFLLLFSEVQSLGMQLETEIMLLVLLGFIFFHSALKFVFQAKGDKKFKIFLIDEIHLGALGLYNFIISFSLVDIVFKDFTSGVLLTVLLTIHFILSDLSNDELHSSKLQYKTLIIVLATFFGAFLRIFDLISISVTAMLYAFSAGAIIYMVIREELPDDNETRPLMFVIGALFFAIVSSFL